MAVTTVKERRSSPRPSETPGQGDGSTRKPRVDLVNVAVLVACAVAITLVLIGVAVRGSNPAFVFPPLALACLAIITLRKKR